MLLARIGTVPGCSEEAAVSLCQSREGDSLQVHGHMRIPCPAPPCNPFLKSKRVWVPRQMHVGLRLVPCGQLCGSYTLVSCSVNFKLDSQGVIHCCVKYLTQAEV